MDKLFLKDFRVFKGEHSFDLKPITILTGKNNSGKSSLIKGVLLVADYLSGKNHTVINFLGGLSEKHKINSFKNAKNDSSKRMAFSIGFGKQGVRYSFEYEGDEKSVSAKLVQFTLSKEGLSDNLTVKKIGVEYELKTKLQFIDRIHDMPKRSSQGELYSDSSGLEEIIQQIQSIEAQLDELVSRKSTSKKSDLVQIASNEQRLTNRLKLLRDKRNHLEHNVLDDAEIHTMIEFTNDDFLELTLDRMINLGLMRYARKDPSQRFSDQELLRIISNGISQLAKGLKIQAAHLGPNRTHQSRLYVNANKNSEISQIINELSLHPLKPGRKADLFLKKWMDLFDIGDGVIVENVEQVASYLYVKKDGKQYNLVDMGFGTGQILTILIKIANLLNEFESMPVPRVRLNYSDFLFLIEEPESNLHPKLQSILAEFFQDAIRVTADYFRLKFIVETHSEYLMRKLQLLTAADKMDTGDTVIYYMDFQNPGEDKYKEIHILDDGRLSDSFGDGFYDEAGKQAIELNRLARKKANS